MSADDLKYSTLGVVPFKPVFYFDVDADEGYGLDDLVAFASANSLKEPDYYKTKHGYNVVASVPSWDEAQRLLDLTKSAFPRATYIRNARKLRLRVGPKFDERGKEVSPPPRLIRCGCVGRHKDKRVGSLVGFDTSD